MEKRRFEMNRRNFEITFSWNGSDYIRIMYNDFRKGDGAKMYQIAVVEDRDSDANELICALNRFSKEKKVAICVKRFVSADSFLFEYEKKYDIVFRDIRRPGTNGRDSAARLRKVDPDIVLVFVTTIARRAIRGYEVNALDFILKPIEYPSFALKLERAFSAVPKNNEKIIVLNRREGIDRIKESEILYLEVKNHTVVYHCLKKDIEINTSLKAARNDLDSSVFYKCNNCYVINRNYVTRIEGYSVTLDGKITLPVSHPKRAEFVKAFHRFVQGA